MIALVFLLFLGQEGIHGRKVKQKAECIFRGVTWTSVHLRLSNIDPRFFATSGFKVDIASRDAAISASWLANPNSHSKMRRVNVHVTNPDTKILTYTGDHRQRCTSASKEIRGAN